MIRSFSTFQRRFIAAQASRHGFTLIELLTVMAIMLLLAGLILAVAGNANTKGSLARAQTEIKQMETAMESYKVDNGAYPRNDDTDALNANTTGGGGDTDPAVSPAASNKYAKACIYLFEQLSGIQPSGTTSTKTYITFLPSQLSSGSTAPTGGTTYIIDPFGLCYGYSTAYQKAQDTANSTTPPGAMDNTKGYNPTFDLWSTAGYSLTGGKSLPSGVTTSTVNTLWVKNW